MAAGQDSQSRMPESGRVRAQCGQCTKTAIPPIWQYKDKGGGEEWRSGSRVPGTPGSRLGKARLRSMFRKKRRRRATTTALQGCRSRTPRRRSENPREADSSQRGAAILSPAHPRRRSGGCQGAGRRAEMTVQSRRRDCVCARKTTASTKWEISSSEGRRVRWRPMGCEMEQEGGAVFV